MTVAEPLTKDYFEKQLDKRFSAMMDLISGIVDNMATKTDLTELESRMASKDDLAELESRMASKEDLAELSSKLRAELASKNDLEMLGNNLRMELASKADLQEFRTEMNQKFEDTTAFLIEHVDDRLQLFAESLSPFIDRTAMIEPMARDIFGLKQDMKIVKVAITSISKQLQGAGLHG
jgi:hypothetical protein